MRIQACSNRAAALGMIALACISGGCQKEDTSQAVAKPSLIERSPELDERKLAREQVPFPVVAGPDSPGAGGKPGSVSLSERVWGRADDDPTNDDVVAPPEPVPNCHARLEAAGIKFRLAHLPLTQAMRGIATCGCHDAVTVTQAPLGMNLQPKAVLSCQMALALAGLEQAIHEMAERYLGEKVRTLHQGGTYSCRKMARFDLVSEHSYGNAIDVFAFTLESGKKVSVLSDYGALDAPKESHSPRAQFLRAVASAAYDRDLTSVSLTPYWDALHRDHFHFDMARYRVDGSRPR